MKKNQIFVFAVFVALLAVACSKDKTKEAALAPVCQTLEMHFDWDNLSQNILDSVYIIVRGNDFDGAEFADTVKKSTAKFTYTKTNAQIDSKEDHCPFIYAIDVVRKEEEPVVSVGALRPVVIDTTFFRVGGSRPLQPEDSLVLTPVEGVFGGNKSRVEFTYDLRIYSVFKDAQERYLNKYDKIFETRNDSPVGECDSDAFVGFIGKKFAQTQTTRVFFRGQSEEGGEYFFASTTKKEE